MPKNALLAIALASIVAAAPAGAIDLTGTWTGSVTCKLFGLDGESSTEKFKDSALVIAQTGETFDAELDLLALRGATIDAAADGARRGQAVLLACDADAVPLDGGVNEFVQLKAKVDAEKGTGTLTGVSLFEHGQNGFMTCKLKYKRTSTTPGVLTPCPM